MATVIRAPEDDTERKTVDEWTQPVMHVEVFGCGEPDDAGGQGIQPLILSGQ